ncbi:septation protein IspZ [Clostridium sp. 19966]|uniref:VC0807 family protein n=1 Tax=Clostridium sp. 19966 TaxID=2768166 RepID=UPI0028DFA3C9|nr:VC0807 family protein [Clostridium sp. 19966]MDT8718821.1 septation protein IspZ [Clostridium sp. 19966]
MQITTKTNNKTNLVLKNVFNADFVVSAIIPIVIFYIFDKFKMTFDGIVLCGVWSIGVVALNFMKDKRFNALAVMSGSFSAISLICTIISKNPTFYLVAPIIQDILIALVFSVSLLFNRSLIQVIVEQSYLKNASEKLKSNPKYKSAWRLLTIAWAVLNVSQAVLRMVLLHFVSISSYYAINTSYNSIAVPALIAFSILFPQWYWKKKF